MAGNQTAAGFIMTAPGDSVAKAVLTLLEVNEQGVGTQEHAVEGVVGCE